MLKYIMLMLSSSRKWLSTLEATSGRKFRQSFTKTTNEREYGICGTCGIKHPPLYIPPLPHNRGD